MTLPTLRVEHSPSTPSLLNNNNMDPKLDNEDNKREKRRGRRWRERPLRGVGKRFRFRKSNLNAPSLQTNAPPTYGALEQTERRKNSKWTREVEDEGDDADDESSLDTTLPSQSNGDRVPSLRFWQSDRPDLKTIAKVESYLRWMILLTGSFLLGAHYSAYQHYVEKACEYSAVAWVTCLSLGFLLAKSSTMESSSTNMISSRDNAPSFDEEEGQPLILRGRGGTEEEVMVVRDGETKQTDSDGGPSENGDLCTPEVSEHSNTENFNPLRVNTHPAMDPYYVVDVETFERVFPNANTHLYKLESEWFTGEMMVLIRTPDVDDSTVDSPPENAAAVHYLRDKQRRFEFQFQVRLKKVPTGTVYFAAELTEPVKLGIVQRAFVSAAMSFVRSSNPSFHYSIQGSTPNAEGTYERPHMSFPVEHGMNRVVSTPPGQKPPRLGTEIEEDAESIKRRKKGIPINWNLDDTYTLALWSAYVDFLDWKVLNLPGLRPFGLQSVIGTQPIYLMLYEIEDDKEKHYRSDINMIAGFEMSNSKLTGNPGPLGLRWKKANQRRKSRKIEDRATDGFAVSRIEHADSPKPSLSFEMEGHPSSRSLKRQLPKRTRAVEVTGVSPASPRDSIHSVDMESVEDEGDIIAQEETPTKNNEGVESFTEEADAEIAAELGEGIYVKSGDSIALRDATDESLTPSFVAMGGGFAVLQEQTTSVIIIEKAGRSKRGQSGRSKLIKSGDTVLFKLVTKGRKGSYETRYLSIHRGWWLKWVNTAPSSNGNFQVFTHETEFDASHSTGKTQEIQSSYLTLGGAFWLRHQRWSKFLVGVAAEGSATYGGRLLGLYTQRKGTKGNLPDDTFVADDLADTLNDQPEIKQNTWLKPLQLRALEPSTVGPVVHGTPHQITQPSSEDKPFSIPSLTDQTILFSEEDYCLDVPVWIEIMDRTHRVPQLAYVVRARYQGSDASGDEGLEKDSFVRLRTGRDLAEIMRIGLTWRTREVAGRRRRGSADLEPISPRGKGGNTSGVASLESSIKTPAEYAPSSLEKASQVEGTDEVNEGEEPTLGAEVEVILEDSEDDDGFEEINETVETIPDGRNRSHSPVKKRKFIGKLAHSVKSKTASTGKAVIKGGVKVGKGTMSAGRKILPIRSMNPPGKEPTQKTPGRSKRQTERDLHVAVSRGMRRIDRLDSPSVHLESPIVLAGELAAPEQSARTVSNMLGKMSCLPRSSQFFTTFNDLLGCNIDRLSPQDEWFLQGGAVQLGIHLSVDGESPLHGVVVARCLWESHWREEWCVVREQSIAFYAPNTKEPGLELMFDDIRCYRELDVPRQSPLPGYSVLVVETAWMCHYVAFLNDDKRDTFRQVARRAQEYVDSKQTENGLLRDKELRKARYWQGFKSSIESSLGKGKWAEVQSSGKMKSRIVLNNRRAVFDLPPREVDYNDFVETMLTKALSFSLDSLLEDPEAFVSLLDDTSYLQILRLEELDFSGPACFCLFVNLYHCLLQHALLLTINGPLTKRSYAHFMRTTCYEIGGDVFSLAEIHYCVIRGGMSRPLNPKVPYIDLPKKSAAFRYYTLGYTTPRVNFVLNTGDLGCRKAVSVFEPEHLEAQLNFASAEFIKKNVKMDESKRLILVPKVCEVFRNDFDIEGPGAASACLQYCLGFMDEALAEKIMSMLADPLGVIVKFQAASEMYHTYLNLDTSYFNDPPKKEAVSIVSSNGAVE